MSPFPMNGRPNCNGAMLPLSAPRRAPDTSAPAATVSEHARLGIPLGIRQVAQLIGCSPWTVRQTLMPRGLPHFRCTRRGRVTFYREQVIRWIERQQIGGPKNK